MPQLLIVVDWSSLTADMKWHWLRASIVVDGRSLTLYEAVHPRKHLTATRVHSQFVKRIKALLPQTLRPPIIITDAGFRSTWFRLIAEQGWYWIGRTRNRDFVRPAGEGGAWFPAKQLYAQATGVVQDLGAFDAVRNNPWTCRFALIKTKPTGRKHQYPSGSDKQQYQKSQHPIGDDAGCAGDRKTRPATRNRCPVETFADPATISNCGDQSCIAGGLIRGETSGSAPPSSKCIPTADGGLRGHVPTRPGCNASYPVFVHLAPQLWIGLPPRDDALALLLAFGSTKTWP